MKYITYNEDNISKLSLGTVQFGLNYGISNESGQPNQDVVSEIITYVIQSGINCFDTAQAYGNSEKVLGNTIKNNSGLKIISKLKSDLFINDLFTNLTESLSNLKIDSLFALLLHDGELLKNWKNEYTDNVSKLTTSKNIKYFGVSIYTSEEFHLALENESINFIQVPFNIFDQRALNENWFNKAREKNKLIFIRSVYLQGLLLMDLENVKNKVPRAYPFIEQLSKICEENKLSRNELALSFVDSVAQDSLLLFGCDNLNQAEENIRNYNNLSLLNESLITQLNTKFKDIPEEIYNPTKW